MWVILDEHTCVVGSARIEHDAREIVRRVNGWDELVSALADSLANLEALQMLGVGRRDILQACIDRDYAALAKAVTP